MMNWYRRIKDLRIDNDMSKEDLSHKLGISERTLTRYENGDSEPTISILIKLSLIFNVSIDYLCCIKDQMDIIDSSTKNEIIEQVKQLNKIVKNME